MQQPFRFENPERHATAMREVAETVMLTADDGQQFSGLHLNRDFSEKPEKPGIARLNAWMSSVVGPEQKYAAYQYAAAHPEQPVVVVDMPSHGRSDNLNDAQRREIVDHGGLELLAGAQAQAVCRHLDQTKEIVAAGDSLGARVATDFARKAGELGVKPLAVVGFDMVGLENRPSVAVAFSFFVSEAIKTRRLYKNNPANRLLDEAYELGFKNDLAAEGFAGSYNMLDVYRRDPKLMSFLFANLPLADDTGIEALEKLLDDQPDISVAIVVGGLSSICRWRKIAPVAQRLQGVYGHRQKLAFTIWPHDSHGMSLAPQQPRMAAYVAKFLETRDQEHVD